MTTADMEGTGDNIDGYLCLETGRDEADPMVYDITDIINSISYR